jgi:hypothetical protein
VALTIHRQKHFIKVPLISRFGAAVPQLIGILLPKFPAPFADRLIRHDDPTSEEGLLHIAGAETEPEIAPDAMADDLGRETAVVIAVDGEWVHALSIAHRPGTEQATQQVDKASVPP